LAARDRRSGWVEHWIEAEPRRSHAAGPYPADRSPVLRVGPKARGSGGRSPPLALCHPRARISLARTSHRFLLIGIVAMACFPTELSAAFVNRDPFDQPRSPMSTRTFSGCSLRTLPVRASLSQLSLGSGLLACARLLCTQPHPKRSHLCKNTRRIRLDKYFLLA